MENDVRQIMEVKEWLREGVSAFESEKKDLFHSVNLGGRMELEQEEDGSLGCVSIKEVKNLLKKCAYELGMTYE